MFSVLKGIKTLTEHSAEGGVSSGLAVDVREYFADDKRYQAWTKVLGHAARRGRHQEIAQGFLLFMRDIKQGRPAGGPASRQSDPVRGPRRMLRGRNRGRRFARRFPRLSMKRHCRRFRRRPPTKHAISAPSFRRAGRRTARTPGNSNSFAGSGRFI